MLFDTHAHMDDRAFDADRDELIASLPDGKFIYLYLSLITLNIVSMLSKIKKKIVNIRILFKTL